MDDQLPKHLEESAPWNVARFSEHISTLNKKKRILRTLERIPLSVIAALRISRLIANADKP